MTALQAYRAYKDSGVEWLGEVPEHWEVRRVKHSLGVNLAVLPEDTEPDYRFRYIDIGSVGTGELTCDPRPLRFETAPSRARRLVRSGDTLVSTVRTYLKAVWHAEECTRDLVASTGFAVLTPRSWILPKYVGYACRSEPFTNHVTAESVGVVYPAIAEAQLASALRLCIPPIPEQRAIARFLDHADRRIQRYIRAKERLIELLAEQKQAIIHQAVTGQVDVRTGQPYPAYKDSGVEWLGEVPEHWQVRRIKSLSVVKRGASPRPIADAKYFDEEGEYAWARIADVTASDRYLEKTTQRLSPLGQSLSVELLPGSLFLSIAGSVGKPIVTRIKCCIHDGFVYFPRFKGDAEFLYRVLSCKGPFGRLGKFGTQLNLNTDTVGGICLGWPAQAEQSRIVQFLECSTRTIDRLVSSIQRESHLAQEYRTRLIADVVTGKLDVREAAARLTDIDGHATEGTLKESGEEIAAPEATLQTPHP